MRDHFSRKLCSFAEDPKFCFLTGDLGYNALENLASKMGERFINAGVSEQNMLSVAAAFSKKKLEAWAYSIGPFCYARAFEQIRNDICFHNLPVRIVGNGGGYAYGVMGPTHHSIEDYGALSTLPNIRTYVPVFNEDLDSVIDEMRKYPSPTYLRLGIDEKPSDWKAPKYKKWRQIINGDGPTIIVAGPIATSYIKKLIMLPKKYLPNMWIISELPVKNIPKKLIHQIEKSNKLIMIEEHVKMGGIGQQISYQLLKNHNISIDFIHLYATSHIYKSYGSQKFLRRCSGLDSSSLLKNIAKLCK